MALSFVYLGGPAGPEARVPVSDRLEEWVPRVYRFALRLCSDPHIAEDLTQETFLRAWRSRSRLRDRAAGRVWLFRITANLWRDRLRRGRSPVERAEAVVDCDIACVIPPDHAIAEREELAKALAAIAQLPPRQREVLHLNAVEGMTLVEIATVLGISREAAKASLSLARQTLRQQWQDDATK